MPKPDEKLPPRRKPLIIPEEHRLAFAQALEEWLKRANRRTRELAGEVGVDSTVVFRWRKGERIPNDLMLLRTLSAFHRWLGEAWSVEEALDGIAPLGWDWDTVQQKVNDLLASGEMRAFREWWEAGKPHPCSLHAPSLPAIYVDRVERALLVEQVTAWAGYRQPRWRGIVVHGVAGAGKTTLAAAIAQDEAVRQAFRDGILWLGVDEAKDLLHLASQRSGPETEKSPDGWINWVADPNRRLLIIADDVVPGRDPQGRDTLDELRKLLRAVGPLVVVVVTTQQGEEVRQEMERWLGTGQVTEIALRGMSGGGGLAPGGAGAGTASGRWGAGRGDAGRDAVGLASGRAAAGDRRIVLLGLMMFRVGWIHWLDVLYGVRTWDLALMVKVALGLLWPLRWIPAAREERERLWEAWKRWERKS